MEEGAICGAGQALRPGCHDHRRQVRALAPGGGALWRIDVILLGLSDESLNSVLALACRPRYLEGLAQRRTSAAGQAPRRRSRGK